MSNENDKTIRPNANVDSTIRPTTNVESTIRPDAEGKTLRPDASGTLRPQNQQDEINRIVQDETEFILGKNVKYEVVKSISKSTGEADIFLVNNNGKQFVLKLYFLGLKQDHDILDIIKKNAGSNLLVDTLEHGVWVNPKTQQERDYELMVYCEGGSLDQLKISHDPEGEKLLGEIALRCACTLDFLHKREIIHGDVKPANFLFLQKEQNIENLALADFGIAKRCDKDGFVEIPLQERTKIYAAPEYYDIIDNKIQISTKTDFFALGMMLLTLWSGEDAFNKMNEFQLQRDKKYGILDYPKDLSSRLLQLMKALTLPNPDTRASFNEVMRWANNEDIYDLKSDNETVRRFKIIFNATKNQIADSPEQLAKFMLEEKDLAIKYLYSGKVAQWFSDNLIPELSQEIEDITENQYPKDKQAGLYVSCYMLDAAMPYYDVKNKAAESSKEIAQSLLNNFSHYQKALANKNDSLFLFLKARGAANVTQTFAPLFKTDSDNRNQLLQLIYTLDPTLPWIVIDENKKKVECFTAEDVLNARYNYVFSDQSWKDLIGEAFLIWLRNNDRAVEGKIRSQKGYTERQAVVLYNLSPKVSYNFQMDKDASDYFFTAEEIGSFMNLRMDEYIENNNRFASGELAMMCNIDNTALYDYFKSKGVYDDKIKWIKYCSDLKSKDNTNKAGPYNWMIGVYKAIKGLGFAPYYYFPKSKKRVFTLDELKEISSQEITKELEKGFLQNWLAVHYQENPSLDLSKKHTYEKETIKYLEHLDRIEPKNKDVVNYNIGANSVKRTLNKLKTKRRIHIWSKILVGLITLLASVAVIYGLLVLKIPIDVNDHVGWISIVAGIAALCGVGIMFLGANQGCIANLIVGAIVGGIFYLILYFCIPFVGYIAIGLLLLSLILCLVKGYFKNPAIDEISKLKGVDHQKLFNPTFEELHLEPLHFAFSDDQNFKSSIARQSLEYGTYLTAATKIFYKQMIFPWLLILLSGVAVVLFSPKFNEFNGQFFDQTTKSVSVAGNWKGTFDNKPSVVNISQTSKNEITATIDVNYKTPLKETLRGTVNVDLKTFRFDDINPTNGVLDGEYNGSFNENFTTFAGEYTNYKTAKKVKFNFSKEESTEVQQQQNILETAKPTVELPPKDIKQVVVGESASEKPIKSEQTTKELQPTEDDMSWYNKGVDYGSSANYTEAIRCYEQAIALNPNMASAWSNMGNSYKSLKNYSESLRCLKKALELNPNNGNIWTNMGTVYHSQKNLEEAIQCYNKAVAIDANNSFAWYNTAVCYSDQKKHSEALKCYKKAAQLGHNTAQSLLKDKGIKW